MGNLTRRTAFSVFSMAPLAMAIPAIAAPVVVARDIERIFQEWDAINREPSPATDEGCEEQFSRYCGLQSELVATAPTTARELALVYFADRDCGGSENSADFEDIIAKLVGREII